MVKYGEVNSAVKSADEDVQQFRDWLARVVRKTLYVYLPLSLLIAAFTAADESTPFKTWVIGSAVFVPLFFLPLPSSVSVSLALLSYIVIVPFIAIESPGLAAYVFKPPVHPTPFCPSTPRCLADSLLPRFIRWRSLFSMVFSHICMPLACSFLWRHRRSGCQPPSGSQRSCFIP